MERSKKCVLALVVLLLILILSIIITVILFTLVKFPVNQASVEIWGDNSQNAPSPSESERKWTSWTKIEPASITRKKRGVYKTGSSTLEYQYWMAAFEAIDTYQEMSGKEKGYKKKFDQEVDNSIQAVEEKRRKYRGDPRKAPKYNGVINWINVGFASYPDAISQTQNMLTAAHRYGQSKKNSQNQNAQKLAVHAARMIPDVVDKRQGQMDYHEKRNRLKPDPDYSRKRSDHEKAQDGWIRQWEHWANHVTPTRQVIEADPIPTNKPVTLSPTTPRPSKWSSCTDCNNLQGRRKRAAVSGCTCAFKTKRDGQVESVHPKEFVDEYKKASGMDKQRMADTARANAHKVIGDVNSEEMKIMKKVVQLEHVKSHVSTVSTADKIQKLPNRGNNEWGVSSYLKNLGDQVSSLKSSARMKISSTRIAQAVARVVAIKGVKRITSRVDKTSSALGKFMLAKSIISGINHGDVTSLAIIGAQLSVQGAVAGGKALTKAATKWGKSAKLISAATKVGKVTKFIGKLAGPVGAAVDIGMSVWSITKAVDRLNGATNPYDRNDAIADIVQDSVSIAVTATVAVVSIAFPPAAPIASAIGFAIDMAMMVAVAAFKAANEVARIEDQLPLLDWEREQVFADHFFDWFGTRKPNYINSLLEEKAANDLAVKRNIDFLKENEEHYSGIVFPSRTLHYEGSCKFTAQVCTVDIAGLCPLWGTKTEIGRACDMNRRCAEYFDYDGSKCIDEDHSNETLCGCRNQQISISDFVLAPLVLVKFQDKLSLECTCDAANKTDFGEPKENSVVDFSATTKLFWERAVPKDVDGAVFQCKPGSLAYQGFTVSEKESRTDYLCENAIALRQQQNKRREGQVMLFALEDGDDKVTLPEHDTEPNLFLMGNQGGKTYNGAGGNDQFMFGSECNSSLWGTISGKSGMDTITIGDKCARGNEVKVDFDKGRLTSGGGRLSFDINGIEEFRGRVGQPDVVNVACSTRSVVGGGGASSSRVDHISIPESSSCDYNVSIVGLPYTKISSRGERGKVVIPLTDKWTGSEIEAHVYPNFRPDIIFSNTTSSQVTDQSFQGSPETLDLYLEAADQNIQFTFYLESEVTEMSIQFVETPEKSPWSVLLLSGVEKGEPLFHHSLPGISGSPRYRKGCDVISNTFEISGADWRVEGGSMTDQFILRTTRVGSLDGGSGIDTLQLHQSFSEHLSVDLGSRKYKRIEYVYGVARVPLTVRTACDTLLVVGQGGTDAKPDLITVAEWNCPERNLQIAAAGRTHVVIEGGAREKSARDSVSLRAHGNEKKELKFELTTEHPNVTNVMVDILVEHKKWTVVSSRVDNEQITVLARLEEQVAATVGGDKDWIKVDLKQKADVSGPYYELPYIQLTMENSTEVPGILVFERQTGKPKVVHVLDGVDFSVASSNVTGFTGIENVFHLATSGKKWRATGGKLDDEFFLRLTGEDGGQYEVHGGAGGQNNILHIGGEANKDMSFLVNLAGQDLGYTSTSSTQRGTVDNIQHVVGREGAPDVIHATCDTKTINGQGGRGDVYNQRDQVIVRYNTCRNQKLLVTARKFTEIRNAAARGEFTYTVEDIVTSPMQLKATRTNRHIVKFQFHPWEYITAVAFDERSETMGWKVSANGGLNQREQTFKLSRDLDADEYNNPVFEFSRAGGHVLSEIRVNTNMATMATFIVEGMSDPEVVLAIPVDVNRFLIDIKSSSPGQPRGTIQGCSDGSRCSANQFWILNLNTPLGIMEGGDCPQKGCSNQLHVSSDLRPGTHVYVDLDNADGTVRTEGGQVLIAKLRNIHKLEGNGNLTTVHVDCSTAQVSRVGKVLVKNETCPLNIVIQLDETTTVFFEGKEYSIEELSYEQDGGAFDEIEDADNDDLDNNYNSTVHYRFARPMSFDPDGSERTIRNHKHNYYFPFTLDSLAELYFDWDAERLSYVLADDTGKLKEYSHYMIVAPGDDEQFYPQPIMLTEDGYRIQVARDGSVFANLGNNTFYDEVAPEMLPELQETANKLGVTMIIQTPTEFFFIGHSQTTLAHDRNALHNIVGFPSHLTGGGADATLYEIVSLDSDVFIYTGYTEDSNDESKQTIDLTDIVVPIRALTGTKYVPKLSSEGSNLIISMDGHYDTYPGRVVIVRGVYPWVAKRVQLLLNNAIMDLVPITETIRRIRRSVHDDDEEDGPQWRIHPRPVLISKDINVYSLLAEDMEDGQEIRLEAASNGTTDGGLFKTVRNGTDLYLTNISSSDKEDETSQTIIITDVYEPSPYLGYKDHEHGISFEEYLSPNESFVPEFMVLPTKFSNVIIDLPGLHLMLNGSGMVNLTNNQSISPPIKNDDDGDQPEVSFWHEAIVSLEEDLLSDMPEIERSFLSPNNNETEGSLNGRQLWNVAFSK